MRLMKPLRDVGFVGYGAYVPRYRLLSKEVSRIWTEGSQRGPIREKSVPGLDEDVVTMSIEALRNALGRSGIDPRDLGAVWVGSESHPYAVKPTGTVVAEAVGAVPDVLAADWQFACKAGTEAIQGAIGLVGSGSVRYAAGIGMDTAQGHPGDALEYTAGAGGAAFIVGPGEEAMALLEGSFSFVTDTPDFWRRPGSRYPEHAARFTGAPGYFRHVMSAAEGILEALDARPSEYAHVVFHQPNMKFPLKAGLDLGFTKAQLRVGLLANEVGNTYAGAALLGLSAILDEAKPGARILVVSFGSGAGADAFSLRATERIEGRPWASEAEAFPDRMEPMKAKVPTTRGYIERRVEIDYARYARHRGKFAAGLRG